MLGFYWMNITATSAEWVLVPEGAVGSLTQRVNALSFVFSICPILHCSWSTIYYASLQFQTMLRQSLKKTSASLCLLHPEVWTLTQNLTELFQHPLLIQPWKKSNESCFAAEPRLIFLCCFATSISNLKWETCWCMKIWGCFPNTFSLAERCSMSSD